MTDFLTPETFSTIRSGGETAKALIDSLVARRDEIVPDLLRILEEDADRIDYINEHEDYIGHLFAMFLLAHFREPRAHQPLIRFFSVPGEDYDLAAGDVVTEDLGAMLAWTFNGDTKPIEKLIENPALNEYVREEGVDALRQLALTGTLPREQVIRYYGELLSGRLEREPSVVWSELALCATDLHPGENFELIRKAYDDGLCDEFYIGLKRIEKASLRDMESVLKESRKSLPGPDNMIKSISFWLAERQKDTDATAKTWPSPIPLTPSIRKTDDSSVGRNAPCPCGSGKKYKKCCGRLG
ncbi:MAG: hypothetical protein QG656_2305 [Candidatus Hydrogenedentes bacterium]|nr:hypothetical protein [Candidatus Hydrogenedentota bacterium]